MTPTTKSKSEGFLCTESHYVQRTKSCNDTKPENDIRFENVINYYKVFKGSNSYVCSKFISDELNKKLDEELQKESDRLSELTQSVSVTPNLSEEEINNQLKTKNEELAKDGTSLSLDINVLPFGRSISFDDRPACIYRFPSKNINLNRSEESVFTMTVSGQQSAASLLAKHWGPQREVIVQRDFNNSLGISIVGGKVRLILIVLTKNVFNKNMFV